MLLKSFPLKLYSFLILTIICSWNSYSQESLLDYKALNIQKDTSRLIQTPEENYLIILSNNNSCRSCFSPLNNVPEFINNQIKDSSINIKFLCRVENNSRARKNHINTLQQSLPNLVNNNNVFFDFYTDPYEYNKPALTGIFGRYKINKTPAIILYESGEKGLVFKYDILYAYIKSTRLFSIEELKKFKTEKEKSILLNTK